MIDFTFVSDEVLREILNRDYLELRNCINQKLDKSTMILSGSIIEAILMDYFLAFPPPNGKTPDQIKKAVLKDLIDWASDPSVGLISNTTKDISSVIREFRNLIHAGVEYRSQIKVDNNKANVAANLVEIVANEIRDNYIKRLGFTADEIIKKIKIDTKCAPIFDQLIQSMAIIERGKLYKALPQEGFSIYQEDISFEEEEIIKIFILLHFKLRQSVNLDIRKAEVNNVYNLFMKNGTRKQVFFYTRFFIDDFNLLEEDQKNTVLNYILNLISCSDASSLFELERSGFGWGFGKYFNDEINIEKLSNLITTEAYGTSSENEYDKEDVYEVYIKVFLNILLSINYDLVEKHIIIPLESINFGKGKEWAKYFS